MVEHQAHDLVGLGIVAGNGFGIGEPFHLGAKGVKDGAQRHHGAAVLDDGWLVADEVLAVDDDGNVGGLCFFWLSGRQDHRKCEHEGHKQAREGFLISS